MNENFSAFQQVMADFTGAGLHSKGYMPIWFAMRRALETNDYNNDGAHNVQDLRQVLKECANGFADGFIVTSIGRDNDVDSTVAMVAELTPAAPTHTFRYNDYDDLIPGDNLYASNFQIARNNLHNYDTRYNSMIANIGDGTLISLDTNWTMMRDHSHQSINMQFMQYAPEFDYLRLSVWRDNKAAYKNDPMVWSLSELFADPCLPVKERDAATQVFLYPNPTPNQLKMTGIPAGIYTYQLIDLSGKLAASGTLEVPNPGMDVSALKSGLYTLLLTGKQKVYSGRFVKN
jgi:hypothetical protein